MFLSLLVFITSFAISFCLLKKKKYSPIRGNYLLTITSKMYYIKP